MAGTAHQERETHADASARDEKRPVLKAALRGARFGALVAGGIMSVIAIFGLYIYIAVDIEPLTMSSMVANLAGMFGGIALTAVYGAIAGAAIMGTHAAIQHRRRDTSRVPQEPTSVDDT